MAKNLPRGPKFSLDVTSEIIAAAKTRDSSHCMIAEAIRAHFPDAQKVSVDLQTIRFSDPKKQVRFTYLTPRVAQLGIVQFDQGVDVNPFRFRLRSAHVTRAGARASDKARALTESEKAASVISRAKRIEERAAKLNQTKLREDGTNVPIRTGGLTAPVMRDENKIPMSRRREFGLRAFIP